MKAILLFILLATGARAVKDLFGTHTFDGIAAEISSNYAGPKSTAWGTASLAILVPVQITSGVTVKQMAWINGATVSGNVDIGIYDSTFNLLVSLGSTAQSGTIAMQVGDIADTALSAGTYYFALASSSATATFYLADYGLGSIHAQGTKEMGVVTMASAFPLPATITPAASIGYIPKLVASQTTTALVP